MTLWPRVGRPALATSTPDGSLPHLWLRGRAEDRPFRRIGGGDFKVKDVERRAHGQARRAELAGALAEIDARRAEQALTDQELRALGVILVLEGAEARFRLQLDSLERLSTHRVRRPMWLVLNVVPAEDDVPERVTVWVSDEYRSKFLELFEKYLEEETAKGQAKNRGLVANVARIRAAVLADLWQSEDEPPTGGAVWWELWLRPDEGGVELLRKFAEAFGLRLAERVYRINDRAVVWLEARWDQLGPLLITSVPLAEIRRPELVDTVVDLPQEDQDELTEDLVARVTPADRSAPTVVHLDTGVRRSHALLAGSLAPEDLHSVVGVSGDAGTKNHGTLMAGLVLFGSLDDLLLNARSVTLRHRLESVKLLPDSAPKHDPLTYGTVTAEAVAVPEAVAPGRQRVLCMPITAPSDARPGEPTLWSASIDALAVGLDVARSGQEITLLGAPNPDSSRLFVISAGNVVDFQVDHRAACDVSPVEDPAQAWNALTVGAYTELVGTPSDPGFAGWTPQSTAGDVSPHSRTSLLFATRSWPIKPDICMEGGNVLTDGTDFDERHPLLSLRSTDTRNDLALGSVNATSAATAQAARLSALACVSYPSFWPETIRGLLVHAAEWTPVMRGELNAAASRAGKLSLLRRYGWGVPDERSVLTSSRNAVTLVTQDEFVPFQGPEFVARIFRLHELPWPEATLQQFATEDVELRVTLSYFVEPTASRRGWRRRYAYASHALRFELRAPTETTASFVDRVNREAQEEESERAGSSSETSRWLVGKNQRNIGSLHQDIWEGSGADLASCGMLAVHPISGWWKNRKAKERVDMPVRYALIVSLRTARQDIDLYTPIAVELEVPIVTAVPAS
jgi:hypothetical protein